MSTLVVEGWSMTTGGGGPKSEEPACGGMKGLGCCAGGCVGEGKTVGGATDGVGGWDPPWKHGQPVAGGTG